MKTIKRIVLGVVSSLLFTLGFAKAAAQIDPLTLETPATGHKTAVADDCVSSCSFTDEDR